VILAQSVDGVLLVADAQVTKASDLNRARAILDQAGARVLGVSLNKLREQHDSYYGYATEPESNRDAVSATASAAGTMTSRGARLFQSLSRRPDGEHPSQSSVHSQLSADAQKAERG
jgi:Mrp family chromosome partitioning ATPase